MTGGSGGIWEKKFDREQESEADHIGLFLMTFAGYDPEEAVRFWMRMQQAAGGNRLPEILSDHPSDARRIQNMQAWVPKARAAKRARPKTAKWHRRRRPSRKKAAVPPR